MVSNHYIGTARFKSIKEPIIGYKCSEVRLYQDANGKERIRLSPIQGPLKKVTVELNATSECPHYKSHNGKPRMFCTCGFHAYHDLSDARMHATRHSMIFQTVSSGKIIMYDKGVRAAQQRVSEVLIQNCVQSCCSMSPDRVAVIKDQKGWSNIVSVCQFHGKYFDCKTFTWLEEKINSSFTKGEPDVAVNTINKTVPPWDGLPFKVASPEKSESSSIFKDPVVKYMSIGMAVVFSAQVFSEILEMKRKW